MQTYNVQAKNNLLNTDIELHPGDIKTNCSNEVLANLSGVKFMTRIVETDGLIAA